MIGKHSSLLDVLQVLATAGARSIYAKVLAANDNSKNQVYLGGSFEVLNRLPAETPVPTTTGSRKKPIFEAALALSWLGSNGHFFPAPHAKLILYPQYPEVRLSGYLRGCADGPAELMGSTRVPERLLLLGIREDGGILAWAGAPDSGAKQDFDAMRHRGMLEPAGVLLRVPVPGTEGSTTREALLVELRRIHRQGWTPSKRLDTNGAVLPCNAQNCGGFTLEAELGIRPNGFSEPDFRGWEIKQHAVGSFEFLRSGPITLMTPEPTGGYYKEKGVVPFLRKYGYPDRRGRSDRQNFGGVHRAGTACSMTGLTLTLLGFDLEAERLTDPGGGIALLDDRDNAAAIWHFSSLIGHWNRKHANAAYVPSMMQVEPMRSYRYGDTVRLGEGTDFRRFLVAMARGHIYYDPGVKAEGWSSGKPAVKRRNQFRIASPELDWLYTSLESVSVA